MYVCVCNAVTEKDIRRAAKSGLRDFNSLQATLGVATNCGSCASTVLDVLADCSGSTSRPRRAVPQLYQPAALA